MKNLKQNKSLPSNKLMSSELEEAHFKITQILQQTVSVTHLIKVMEMAQQGI